MTKSVIKIFLGMLVVITVFGFTGDSTQKFGFEIDIPSVFAGPFDGGIGGGANDGGCCDSGENDNNPFDGGIGGGANDGGCCDDPWTPPEPEPEPEPPVCLYLKANGKTGTLNLPYGGGSVELDWASSGANSATLTPDGEAVNPNSSKTVNVTDDVSYILHVFNYDGQGICKVDIDVAEPVGPSCDSFKATPSTLDYPGGDVTLTWETSNVDSVSIDQGIGAVAEDNTTGLVQSVTQSITYTLTASKAGFDDVTCPAPVAVGDPGPDPVTCEDNANFHVTPTNLPYGGGDVTLSWNATKVDSVKLDGAVVANSETGQVESVTANKTFVLEITGDATTAGNTVQCPIPVTVGAPSALTCDDVTFTASDRSVRKGRQVTLDWSVSSKVDDVSINNGIGSVNKSDSTIVTVNNDITYNITISNATSNKSCPLSIKVDNGGGGGGSTGPRCGLDISDEKISLGESVTLTWDTTRAYEMTITDDEGNIITTTGDKGDSDYEKDLLDGDTKVKPTKDTKYTLLAERGSKTKKCYVEVEVGSGVKVFETRNQQPRVAGISLTTVPYTGFDAGPTLTIIFYTLLTLWALFVAYVVVLKRDGIGGVSFAGAHEHNTYTDVSVANDNDVNEVEAYVASETTATIPANLPTATPVVGYAAALEMTETAEEEKVSEFTELENLAHSHNVLLSTDAMRYVVSTHGTGETAVEALKAIMTKAKASFPSEDGWLVLNLARVEGLVGELDHQEIEAVAEVEAPVATGSLAEAIVTGNIIAAYEMIGNRPMVSLAAAATDLDALYRIRKGEEATVSTLLETESAKLTNGQIQSAISALTGALDGTYSTEGEAVKMAILKAVKAVA